jgi:uncharacterized protein with HEPN domain
MPPDPILEFTEERTPVDYEDDALLRSAVERNFEVIGEALRRIEQTDPDTANRISDYRKIIGFRNRLIHGYDTIENEQVWKIIERFLPILKADVERLLQEAELEADDA